MDGRSSRRSRGLQARTSDGKGAFRGDFPGRQTFHEGKQGLYEAVDPFHPAGLGVQADFCHDFPELQLQLLLVVKLHSVPELPLLFKRGQASFQTRHGPVDVLNGSNKADNQGKAAFAKQNRRPSWLVTQKTLAKTDKTCSLTLYNNTNRHTQPFHALSTFILVSLSH